MKPKLRRAIQVFPDVRTDIGFFMKEVMAMGDHSSDYHIENLLLLAPKA